MSLVLVNSTEVPGYVQSLPQVGAGAEVIFNQELNDIPQWRLPVLRRQGELVA